MYRKMKSSKSEMNASFIRKRIKSEPNRSPQRFSRRIRKMAPENFNLLQNIRENLKRERENRHVISKKSSMEWKSGTKHSKFRRIRYPQHPRNSKEVISILSAPKICSRKQTVKKLTEVPVRIKGCCCKPKMVVKGHQPEDHSLFMVAKNHPMSARKCSNEAGKLLEKRKRYVLEVLNKGDMKEIEKLHSVGSKTAERIILYRQLKGTISKISELAEMPKFPYQRFQNFVEVNFLKTD